MGNRGSRSSTDYTQYVRPTGLMTVKVYKDHCSINGFRVHDNLIKQLVGDYYYEWFVYQAITENSDLDNYCITDYTIRFVNVDRETWDATYSDLLDLGEQNVIAAWLIFKITMAKIIFLLSIVVPNYERLITDRWLDGQPLQVTPTNKIHPSAYQYIVELLSTTLAARIKSEPQLLTEFEVFKTVLDDASIYFRIDKAM